MHTTSYTHETFLNCPLHVCGCLGTFAYAPGMPSLSPKMSYHLSRPKSKSAPSVRSSLRALQHSVHTLIRTFISLYCFLPCAFGVLSINHFGVLPGQILWHDVDLLVPTITSFPLQSLLCHGLPQLLNFSQGSEKCFCEALPGIK